MTKEKAIEILKYIKHVGNGESEYVGCAQEIALDMAIKSLEQKMLLMIENDKEFRETIEEYLKSKGIELDENSFMDKNCFCNALECENCVLNDIKDGIRNDGDDDELFDICTDKPFQEIKRCEERIRLLKQEISIMSAWKRNRDMNKKL